MDLNHSQNTLTTFAGINVLLPNFKPTLFSLCRPDFYFASWLTVRYSHSRVLEGHCQAAGGRRSLQGSQQLVFFLAVQE